MPSASSGWSVGFVALLAEGVDRNHEGGVCILVEDASPSSRRAWIEILKCHCAFPPILLSPSSRRAWIEIRISSVESLGKSVALLAEGVDRNLTWSPC